VTLSAGDIVPDFDLPADGGGRISSAALRGRPFVLYLYPKDDTPGCTTEAQGFASFYQEFQDAGVEVIGVSRDDVASHDRFKQKYCLTFPLASDEDGRFVESVGSWVEKSNYGRKYMGIDRSTFLVDADGRVVRAWRSVKVPGHVEEVLAAAKELSR
jgi:peroxiredoxin Q/BCP